MVEPEAFHALNLLLRSFLVPLLQNEMVVVMGHVAYDCGEFYGQRRGGDA